MTYTCKTCHQDKPLDQYWPQKTKLGHFVECKACNSARQRGWVNSNRGKFREMNLAATHKYRQKDPRARLVQYARRRAKEKGVPFDISVDALDWPTHCPILGIELVSTFGQGGRDRRAREAAPSLDRVDPSGGYTKENTVVVSWRANRIKSDASLDELRKLVNFYDRVAERGSE